MTRISLLGRQTAARLRRNSYRRRAFCSASGGTTGGQSVAEPDTQTRRQSIASPTDCFAFSGAGWLTPFHCGAARALLDHGVITPTTKLAGASGGALIAASTACGISPLAQMEAYKRMASICRKQGFVGKVRRVLHESLDENLPPNAHIIAKGRLTVAVMQIWPRLSLNPELLTDFDSREDLIEALLTSSYVPLYLEHWTKPWTVFRQGLYVDGGLVDIVPPVKDSIKICVFPGNVFFRNDIHISPALLPDFPFSLHQLVAWAFVAPEDAAAEVLLRSGYEAAMRWMDRGGKAAPPAG